MRSAGDVSVIIPTYNRAPLLRQALDSVLAQTVPVLEIMVVDDGSTDDTAQVVSEREGRGVALSRIALEHTNDLGHIRHTGIQRAAGSIIALLDSDDHWEPQRIERQLAHWNCNAHAGYAFCNIRRFDSNGPFPGGPWLHPSRDYNGRILSQLLLEPVVLPSALMFDRDIYDRVGPYPDRPVNEDYAWLLEAAAIAVADYVAEPLVLMRSHEMSRSREMSLRASTEYLAIVREFVQRHPGLNAAERRSARLGMANVHVKIARHMLQLNRPNRAARAAAGAIRLHPTDRRAYTLLAAALTRKRIRSREVSEAP